MKRILNRMPVLVLMVALCAGATALADELRDAVNQGDEIKVAELVRKNPASVNQKDADGLTPLHYAALMGRSEIVRTLLGSKRTDVNIQDNAGETPLHKAAALGNREIVEMLLKKKAKVNTTDATGTTPLHLAAMNGYSDIVAVLLQAKAKADVRDEGGQTPLHKAASFGNLNTVTALATAGKNALNLRDGSGVTALSLAEMNKRTDIAEYLRAQGARD